MKVRAIDMDDLLNIYLDGFASGVLTIMVNQGISQAEAWEFAQSCAAQVIHDPAIVETMRGKIRDRLSGEDKGPQFLRTVDGQ